MHMLYSYIHGRHVGMFGMLARRPGCVPELQRSHLGPFGRALTGAASLTYSLFIYYLQEFFFFLLSPLTEPVGAGEASFF